MSSGKTLLACTAVASALVFGVGTASAATLIIVPDEPGAVSGTVTIDKTGMELFEWTTTKPFDWTFTVGVPGFSSTHSGPPGPASDLVNSSAGTVVDWSLVTSAIPEAATWLMMLLGVGLVGTGLRVQARHGTGTLA
jgi:hypothetical protein